MPMTPAKQILEETRRKIIDPAMWGKGMRHRNRPVSTCCIAEAFEESATLHGHERQRALKALYNAAGLNWPREQLVEWNDEPERTHDEVIKTLNLAIALVV